MVLAVAVSLDLDPETRFRRRTSTWSSTTQMYTEFMLYHCTQLLTHCATLHCTAMAVTVLELRPQRVPLFCVVETPASKVHVHVVLQPTTVPRFTISPCPQRGLQYPRSDFHHLNTGPDRELPCMRLLSHANHHPPPSVSSALPLTRSIPPRSGPPSATLPRYQGVPPFPVRASGQHVCHGPKYQIHRSGPARNKPFRLR